MRTRPTDPQAPLAPQPRHARRRSRLAIGGVVLAILAGAGALVEIAHPYGISLAHPLGVRQPANPAGTGNGAATTTATVARQSLSARTSLTGTLGYAGDYTVTDADHGTMTWLPSVGQVIGQGEVLYRVDGQPVVLLYGSTPAYRALAQGQKASDVTGTDVRQLNRDLVALGYASAKALNPSSNEFTGATTAAIKALQKHLGVAETGRFDLGQVVFLPTAARVTSLSATLGGQTGGPILKASSTTRQVTVNLGATRQSQIAVGEQVGIALPDGRTTTGRVSAVGTVATTPANDSTSGPTVEVDISPTDASATGTLDQAPVQVQITTDTVRDALAVPVTALVALAGGGYAVEVFAPDGTRHLVAVSLGLFDDDAGLVQVTGAGLAAGQRVVVPA
ncbi:peptidoglycan-binding protein [Amycolatopsis alkalitolerans]|nr:peptidoglycan-binding protein [Amycolatopsis alkalitolerans]